MENFKLIEPSQLPDNVINLIGKEWLLVSAGDQDKHNTMTASWGAIGYYSNKSVATIYIRPERYTYEFIESKSHFTLTVLEDGHRDALMLLGKTSGRDGDKISKAGLTPIFTELGNPTFKEARVVLECRKIFGQMMSEESFVDNDCYAQWYGDGHGNLHKVYMGIIENCWIKE